MLNTKKSLIPADEVLSLELEIQKKHEDVSKRKTPKAHIKKRPDGFDYIDEAYMRHRLNEDYPIWSWSPAGDTPVSWMGSEWVVVTGVLRISDGGVTREFFSPGATRIQFKRNKPHVAENVIDIDKNLASANTNAFKRAANRLCNIGDDVYGKQVEDIYLTTEHMLELAELLEQNNINDDVRNSIMEKVTDGDVNIYNWERFKETIPQLKGK